MSSERPDGYMESGRIDRVSATGSLCVPERPDGYVASGRVCWSAASGSSVFSAGPWFQCALVLVFLVHVLWFS